MTKAVDLEKLLEQNRQFHSEPSDLLMIFRLRFGDRGDPAELRRQVEQHGFRVEVRSTERGFFATAEIALAKATLSVMNAQTRRLVQGASSCDGVVEDLSYSTADCSQYFDYQ